MAIGNAASNPWTSHRRMPAIIEILIMDGRSSGMAGVAWGATLRVALVVAAAAGPAHARLPVFYSPSSAEREAKMDRFLALGTRFSNSPAPGAHGWCVVKMATIHADALTVDWNGTLGAPLYLRDKVAAQPPAGSTQPGGAPETHIVLRPPYGERFYIQTIKKIRIPLSGIGSAHKAANAVFHLRAAKCFATRCHPCVATADYDFSKLSIAYHSATSSVLVVQQRRDTADRLVESRRLFSHSTGDRDTRATQAVPSHSIPSASSGLRSIGIGAALGAASRRVTGRLLAACLRH